MRRNAGDAGAAAEAGRAAAEAEASTTVHSRNVQGLYRSE